MIVGWNTIPLPKWVHSLFLTIETRSVLARLTETIKCRPQICYKTDQPSAMMIRNGEVIQTRVWTDWKHSTAIWGDTLMCKGILDTTKFIRSDFGAYFILLSEIVFFFFFVTVFDFLFFLFCLLLCIYESLDYFFSSIKVQFDYKRQ